MDGLNGLDGRCRICLYVFHLLLQLTHLSAHVVDVATQFKQNLIENLALVLKGVVAVGVANNRQLRGLLVLRDEICQNFGRDGTLLTEYGYLLSDILQLSHVTRPLVAHQHVFCLVGQRDTLHTILLCHLHGKETEQ